MAPTASTSFGNTSAFNQQPPSSVIKRHRPYFSPSEVASLSSKQRGKLSERAEEKARQTACTFAENVGGRMGFPRRTIATAQSLFHRFHLFFPLKDFTYTDVVLACLYVSCKLHDTLKKPREIVLTSFAIRFPELLKAKGVKGGMGVLGEGDVDPVMLEGDRSKLLSIERLILETVCFNFKVHMPFPFVIKFGKALEFSKRTTQAAWRIAIDSNRTLIPLIYPPHQIALASLYLAALLGSGSLRGGSATPDYEVDSPSTEKERCSALVSILGKGGDWEETYRCKIGDIEDIIQNLLDLYSTTLSDNPPLSTSVTSNLNSLASDSSPTSLDSSSGAASPSQVYPTLPTSFRPSLDATADDFVQLKILLRQGATNRGSEAGSGTMRVASDAIGAREEKASEDLDGAEGAGGEGDAVAGGKGKKGKDVWGGGVSEGVGKNDGSVRFFFE